MLNQYPAWKYALIALIVVMGAVFALPNVFGEDPAVQISGERGVAIDELTLDRVTGILDASSLTAKSSSLTGQRVLLRFSSTDEQLQARDLLIEELGRGYIVALNLAPAMPDWLAATGLLPMYLGLDLRGGVHFLMEVDMVEAVKQAEERYASDIKTRLREEKIRYRIVSRNSSGGLTVKFRDAENRARAERLLRNELSELNIDAVDAEDGPQLSLALSETTIDETRVFALEQNVTTLRNRVNELGVAEPVIQRQGENRIVVQLPGVQDTAKAKEILGATATLDFRMVDEENSVQDALNGRVPVVSRLYRERNGTPHLLLRSVMLSGESIIDAASGIEQQSGSPAVFITLDGRGARIFSERTKDKIGRSMATVFREVKSETVRTGDKETKRTRVDEFVINVAVIRDRLGKRFQITGLDSTSEARDLALLLRAGALAAPIEIIEERTVGPSLGQENIDKGFQSVIIGFVLVLAFMAIYYRVFGLVANLALFVNVIMLVGVLSMFSSSGFPATLTLPGIAGIVLTVGMAVDANVLIFERIREEIRNGNTPQASIHAGYAKAFSTILDANVTTLIAAVCLCGFGTGPIKGFAVTLSIGIVTSMFTAIMGTRAVVNLIYGGRRVTNLTI
jgi:preprotein translocase subunit SecD